MFLNFQGMIFNNEVHLSPIDKQYKNQEFMTSVKNSGLRTSVFKISPT